MRKSASLFAAPVLLSVAAVLPVHAGAPQAIVAARVAIGVAVGDKDRPPEDVARDAARKPAEMLRFATIHPGAKVGELLPGHGYFTRMFAKAVGVQGAVYVWFPASAPSRWLAGFDPVLANPAYANVKRLVSEVFTAPEPLDVVWTSQNYHDLHLRGGSAQAVNAAVFAALKPGGLYVVEDHAAVAGSGVKDVDTLHRIDQALVRAEVEQAGFVFAGETQVLRNPADDHTQKVIDMHDATDQFVMRFTKPAK